MEIGGKGARTREAPEFERDDSLAVEQEIGPRILDEPKRGMEDASRAFVCFVANPNADL